MKKLQKLTDWHKVKFIVLSAHILTAIGVVFWFDPIWLTIGLIVSFILYGYGGSIGYHRIWTHKAIDVSSFVKYSTLATGTIIGIGSLIGWAGQHRQHHAFSDVSKELDPYWAHDDYSFKGTIKAWVETPRAVGFKANMVKDLLRDKFIKFQHTHYYKLYWGWLLLLFIIDPLFGFYLGALPSFVAYSLAQVSGVLGHRIGKRTYNTPDKSCDSHALNIFTLGEAYQNTHHKYPTNHKLGKYDICGMFINTFLIKNK